MKIKLKTIFSAPSLTDILSPKPEIKGTDMILHVSLYLIIVMLFHLLHIIHGSCSMAIVCD